MVLSAGALVVTMWLMTLLVPWRVLMRGKRKQSADRLPRTERRQRTIATWSVRGVILVLPFVWAYCLAASILASRPEVATRLWLLDSVAGFLRACPARLQTIDIFGWHPKAAVGLDPDAFFAGLIAMSTLALIIGLWNLGIVTWMRVKWHSIAKTLALDFVDYQENDPTDPN